MKTVVHKAETRGHANHGWLDAHHSFSFAGFYDPKRMQFGTLRVLNDDWIDGGKGFGRHPHDNMEIITIPLYGDLEHKDSMGNHGVVRQNDVQVMSAGTGIYHSEFNANPSKKINLFQIWVMPKEIGIAPRYDQKTYLPEERQNRFQTVVGADDPNALKINQDAWFSLGNFEKGKEPVYEVRKKGNGVYLMVVEGAATIEGQTLGKRDAIGLWETDTISIKADSDVEILLLDVPMLA
jgi:redox-sensitive bicupin YhaK (pirin superfamily)